MEEMGCGHRDSISRWFRELEFYGFIAKTAEGCLGVDGKGKAPQWRLTEAEGPGGRNGDTWSLPTKDYLKWDGTLFEDVRGEVKRKRLRKQKPGLESEARVARNEARPGPESEATSLGNWPRKRGHIPGPRWPRKQAISRLTTGGGAGGRLVKKEQGKVPWSTPILEPVPGDYDRATLANADIF